MQRIYYEENNNDVNLENMIENNKIKKNKVEKYNKNNIKMNNTNMNPNINQNNIKLKNKRGKTPNMKSKNLRFFEEKNINNYHPEKEYYAGNKNMGGYNELNMLKEIAVKLEQELNNNQMIIQQQNEENTQLKNKIDKLTKVLKSFI